MGVAIVSSWLASKRPGSKPCLLREKLLQGATNSAKHVTLTRLAKRAARIVRRAYRRKCGQKIFCVGRGKTGTTSLAKALHDLGFEVGQQPTAELLIDDWARRDFQRFVAYCHSAQAFQDIPFSLDNTYQALDHAFPGSKFILTVRNSAEEWFDSLTRFHAQILETSIPPTEADLARADYLYPGWMLHLMRLVYGPGPLYDKPTYMRIYEQHNQSVCHYFAQRPNDLLVLNVASEDALDQLGTFLGACIRSSLPASQSKSSQGR